MKKRVVDITLVTLVTIVLWIIILLIHHALSLVFVSENSAVKLKIFKYFFLSPLIPFWLAGVSYNAFWSFKKRMSSVLFGLIFILCGFFSYRGLMILDFINSESEKLFSYFTEESNIRGWEGKVHRSDDTLGFRPIPGSAGFHIKPMRDKIPMRYNRFGFRASADDFSKDSLDASKKTVLFLGCSFTYGDACIEEDTFARITSDSLNMNCLNAGVCGYGLSQMVLLSEELIPLFKPDYVVIQFSPWLAERSIEITAPSYSGMIPTPFFSCKDDGNLRISLPVYSTDVFQLNRSYIRRKYTGNYLKFYLEIGFRFGLNEHRRYRIVDKHNTEVCSNTDKVALYGYSKIAENARKYGSRIVVLKLGDPDYSKKAENIFKDFGDTAFAEADSFLSGYLNNSPTKNFSFNFHHWINRNDSIIIIDKHPNPKAHSIIANSIITAISDSK